MSSIKYYFLAFISFSILTTHQTSSASCTLTGNLEFFTESNYDRFTINPALPTGTVLTSFPVDLPGESTVDCNSSFDLEHTSPLPYLGNNLYQTLVPGIALKFSTYNTYIFPYNQMGITAQKYTLKLVQIYAYIIKTGPITQGGVLFTPGTVIGNANITSSGITQPLYKIIWNKPVPISIGTPPTCTVTAPDTLVTVNFNTVNLASFDGEGRSPPVDFVIKVNCSGASNGGTRSILITLTDQSLPSNRSTQLSLAPGSTASGVVVEVRNKYGLVNYGPDSAVIGNPGQWFEVAAPNGFYAIPLSANYLKVNSNPTQGSANANATFTMSYQ